MPEKTSPQMLYRDAYDRWQVDLLRLHSLLIDGEQMDAAHRIALLRRESHSHDRYEQARRRLIGLPEPDEKDLPSGAGGADDAQ